MIHRRRSEGFRVHGGSDDSTRSQSLRDHFCDHSRHPSGSDRRVIGRQGIRSLDPAFGSNANSEWAAACVNGRWRTDRLRALRDRPVTERDVA